MEWLPILVLSAAMTSPIAEAQVKAQVQPPRVLSVLRPDCPKGSACHNVKGTVVMIVGVNGDGTVADVKVVSGDPTLQDAAVQAARKSQYAPASLNGVVTYAQLTLSMNFK